MVTRGRRGDEGAHRLRAQPGPRARHGLARPRPPGLQLPPDRHRVRHRPGPAGAPGRHARRPRAGGGLRTARRWRASRGSGCRARTPAATAAAGSCSSCRCRAGATATRSSTRCAMRGVQCKPYLPAIHLMSFYRERFGHREGEFPVCEDVAARSVALPFFPAMTEGQVAAGGRGTGGGGRPGSIIGPWRACEPTRSAHAAAGRGGSAPSGFVGAAALPIVLWHRVIADIASEFRLDAKYLITGWSPWVLMALGLLCFVPVVRRGLARSRPALPPRRHGRLDGVGHHAVPARLRPRHPGRPDRRWPERCVSCAACVSRFREPQDPAFQALNASIGFDRRLWPHDVAQSRAHARMLAAQGMLSRRGSRRAAGRPGRRRGRAARGHASRSRPTTRTSTWPSSGGSPSSPGPVGGRLHTARSRNDQVATDVALFTREAALAGRRRASTALMARARSTPPSATSTGRCRATRTCSAPSRSTSAITCWPTCGCSSATARGCASPPSRRRRCRSAPARWRASTSTPTAARSRPSSASSASRPTRSTRSPTATSSWTTWAPPRPARRTSRASGAELVLWSSRGVRLRRAARRLDERLVDHAPEEEPRRGRAAAGQGAAHRRRTSPPCTA